MKGLIRMFIRSTKKKVQLRNNVILTGQNGVCILLRALLIRLTKTLSFFMSDMKYNAQI